MTARHLLRNSCACACFISAWIGSLWSLMIQDAGVQTSGEYQACLAGVVESMDWEQTVEWLVLSVSNWMNETFQFYFLYSSEFKYYIYYIYILYIYIYICIYICDNAEPPSPSPLTTVITTTNTHHHYHHHNHHHRYHRQQQTSTPTTDNNRKKSAILKRIYMCAVFRCKKPHWIVENLMETAHSRWHEVHILSVLPPPLPPPPTPQKLPPHFSFCHNRGSGKIDQWRRLYKWKHVPHSTSQGSPDKWINNATWGSDENTTWPVSVLQAGPDNG